MGTFVRFLDDNFNFKELLKQPKMGGQVIRKYVRDKFGWLSKSVRGDGRGKDDLVGQIFANRSGGIEITLGLP